MSTTKTDQNITSISNSTTPASTIVSAVINGSRPIKVEVSSKQPTDEQLQEIDIESIANGQPRWIVKSIERKEHSTILISFWNGVKVTSFDPLYIIEREVSNG